MGLKKNENVQPFENMSGWNNANISTVKIEHETMRMDFGRLFVYQIEGAHPTTWFLLIQACIRRLRVDSLAVGAYF